MNVIIIDYGAGNIQSIQFALQRLGITAVLSNNPEVIQSADKVIFPGVGEASQAMQMLKNSRLDALIPNLKQEVLGICLGMQLLCKHSEEGDTKGHKTNFADQNSEEALHLFSERLHQTTVQKVQICFREITLKSPKANQQPIQGKEM